MYKKYHKKNERRYKKVTQKGEKKLMYSPKRPLARHTQSITCNACLLFVPPSLACFSKVTIRRGNCQAFQGCCHLGLQLKLHLNNVTSQWSAPHLKLVKDSASN